MPKVDTFLKALLLKAGRRLLTHFGSLKTIKFKGGTVVDLLTNADEDLELYIKQEIRKAFPEDAILAEESELENESGQRKWIIDPLDGTTNFAHGLPLFAISIGVEERGKIVTGGVYGPALRELFFAIQGKGATLNGRSIRVSSVRKLSKSLLCTGFPYDIHDHPERSLPYFNGLIQQAQGVRRLGSAALDLCYLAMSRFDGFFEVYLHPWDTAAGSLILTEAGGKITNFEGQPFSIYHRQLAASNGKIHSEMIRAIQKIKQQPTMQEELWKMHRALK